MVMAVAARAVHSERLGVAAPAQLAARRLVTLRLVANRKAIARRGASRKARRHRGPVRQVRAHRGLGRERRVLGGVLLSLVQLEAR